MLFLISTNSGFFTDTLETMEEFSLHLTLISTKTKAGLWSLCEYIMTIYAGATHLSRGKMGMENTKKIKKHSCSH